MRQDATAAAVLDTWRALPYVRITPPVLMIKPGTHIKCVNGLKKL